NEAYQFACNETLARTESTRSGPQHAAYEIRLTGTGDLVLTALRTHGARLALAHRLTGRVYVRDADGHLAAELDKGADGTREINLPPGAYVVRVLKDGKLHEARVELVDGESLTVETDMLTPIGTEDTIARGPR